MTTRARQHQSRASFSFDFGPPTLHPRANFPHASHPVQHVGSNAAASEQSSVALLTGKTARIPVVHGLLAEGQALPRAPASLYHISKAPICKARSARMHGCCQPYTRPRGKRHGATQAGLRCG
ncbi:hypothetical protein L1887_54066 [Cichorium endivia]|nr:hypothetical protein L1887_54066 [Cichorium endivia]